MKFQKRPVVIDADRWFTLDQMEKIVKKHLCREDIKDKLCSQCKKPFGDHGRVRTPEGWHIVCPGDWIIKGVEGEYYPCKPSIFQKTYELVEG
jgi:hypothetical protein